MIRIGTVIAKESQGVRVRFEKMSACAGCSGCGQGKNTTDILVRGGTAEVGDRVSVRLPEGKLLRLSVLVYVFPLMALILGLIIGGIVAPGKESVMLLLGLGLMALSFAVVKLADKKIGQKAGWSPEIIEVNPSVEQQDAFVCSEMGKR